MNWFLSALFVFVLLLAGCSDDSSTKSDTDGSDSADGGDAGDVGDTADVCVNGAPCDCSGEPTGMTFCEPTGPVCQCEGVDVGPDFDPGDMSDMSDMSDMFIPPTQTAICNEDTVCDPGETCSTCPAECGSCDVAMIMGQTAKYVDGACPEAGDGLSDSCAGTPGGAGRFNDLQTALDSLVAGDTLYIHAGDYWRVVNPWPRDSSALFTLDETQDGTANAPIVITAADRNNPPVIHSCDPSDPGFCPAPAMAIYADFVTVDHLEIRGRLQLWGTANSTMQYLECTHGWGACGDGNWSCLRFEASTDGVAHHNNVHSLSGAGQCETCEPGASCLTDLDPIPDRGAGLKEFSSDRLIWEFNTVRDAPRWGYDLHRNSNDVTVRFNHFMHNSDSAIHMDRTRNATIVGNVMVATGQNVETPCVDVAGQNEMAPGAHFNDVHHNTCALAHWGVVVGNDTPSAVHNNAMVGLALAGGRSRNVLLDGNSHTADYNAYDEDSDYTNIPYDEMGRFETLAEWQAASGQDANSMESAGGPCTFVDAPSDGTDTDYDLHMDGGPCVTSSSTGGEVGAYGLTDCVGHLCP